MKIEIACAGCDNKFLIERKSYNQNVKNGWKCYCSKECQQSASITAVKFKCSLCGVESSAPLHQYNRSKGGEHFCSRTCANTYHNKGKSRTKENALSSYRQRALKHYGSKCSVCGYDIEEVLEVHHRDGNRRHNKVENLDVLCPTHHTEYQRGIRKY